MSWQTTLSETQPSSLEATAVLTLVSRFVMTQFAPKKRRLAIWPSAQLAERPCCSGLNCTAHRPEGRKELSLQTAEGKDGPCSINGGLWSRPKVLCSNSREVLLSSIL